MHVQVKDICYLTYECEADAIGMQARTLHVLMQKMRFTLIFFSNPSNTSVCTVRSWASSSMTTYTATNVAFSVAPYVSVGSLLFTCKQKHVSTRHDCESTPDTSQERVTEAPL